MADSRPPSPWLREEGEEEEENEALFSSCGIVRAKYR